MSSANHTIRIDMNSAAFSRSATQVIQGLTIIGYAIEAIGEGVDMIYGLVIQVATQFIQLTRTIGTVSSISTMGLATGIAIAAQVTAIALLTATIIQLQMGQDLAAQNMRQFAMIFQGIGVMQF